MTIVETKQLSSLMWYSFATYNGYDYSEDGSSATEAQSAWRDLVARNNWPEDEFEYAPQVEYVFPEKAEKEDLSHLPGFNKFGIDNKPFA